MTGAICSSSQTSWSVPSSQLRLPLVEIGRNAQETCDNVHCPCLQTPRPTRHRMCRSERHDELGRPKPAQHRSRSETKSSPSQCKISRSHANLWRKQWEGMLSAVSWSYYYALDGLGAGGHGPSLAARAFSTEDSPPRQPTASSNGSRRPPRPFDASNSIGESRAIHAYYVAGWSFAFSYPCFEVNVSVRRQENKLSGHNATTLPRLNSTLGWDGCMDAQR